MSYQPEIDPVLAVDYPLERARLYNLFAGIDALKKARRSIPNDTSVAEPQRVPEQSEVVQMPQQRTASEMLAELREQIQREAA